MAGPSEGPALPAQGQGPLWTKCASRERSSSRAEGHEVKQDWAFLDRPPPIPIAHRGGSLEAPENTMRAFAHAVSLGYTHVELDVRTTTDGVPMVFHDEMLVRVTSRPGRLDHLTREDLRHVRVAGSEPIPTLAELIDAWPDLRIIVELKDDRSVEPVARLCAERDAYDRTCIASFSGSRLARVRALSGGRARTSIGTWGAARLRAGSYGLPVGRPPGECVQVPLRHRGIPLMDRRFIDHCHRSGLPVQVWTVNDRAEMERLLDLGVDGLMTDRPTLLKQVLTERAGRPESATA